MSRTLFTLRVTVKDGEHAILTRNGRFERALEPGRHTLFDVKRELAVELHQVVRAEFPGERYAVLKAARPDLVAELFEAVETKADEVAIVSLDGRPTKNVFSRLSASSAIPSLITSTASKLPWKLLNNAAAEHIRHFQRLKMDFVIRSNGCLIVTLQIGDSLFQSQIQVFSHHRLHLFKRPILGIGRVEEFCDVIRVNVPTLTRIFQCGCVTAFCRLEYFCGNQNMLGEQRGQLFAGFLAVKRLNGIANVNLVLQ
jgi:hypothetical protein